MHGKRRSLPKAAAGMYASVQRVHQVLHNRQPQAGPPQFSGAGLVDTIKTFEDPREILFGDADACVLNFQADLAVLRSPTHADPPPWECVFHGVVDQVIENLMD